MTGASQRKRLTYLKYRNTRGDQYRINLGKKKI